MLARLAHGGFDLRDLRTASGCKSLDDPTRGLPKALTSPRDDWRHPHVGGAELHAAAIVLEPRGAIIVEALALHFWPAYPGGDRRRP
jgi:hypothetical protein